jgi:hypothetical protein
LDLPSVFDVAISVLSLPSASLGVTPTLFSEALFTRFVVLWCSSALLADFVILVGLGSIPDQSPD